MPGGLFHLLGDIVAILDSNGTAVVQYKYDAWGRQIGCDVEAGNSNATALSTLNPFRYRGYVYDEETGLYYLRNRYYDMAMCRFLNADNLIGSIGRPCSHNFYAYGANTVITVADYDGQSIIMLTDDANLSHTSLLIRDYWGQWHYFYWGANPETAEVSFQAGTCYVHCEVNGPVALAINAISNQPGNGVLIYEHITFDYYPDDDSKTLASINTYLNMNGLYDYKYDRMIYFELPTILSGSAHLRALYLERKQAELTYNLFTNNCAQMCLDVMGYGLALDNLLDLESMKAQLTNYGKSIWPLLIHLRIDADNYYND